VAFYGGNFLGLPTSYRQALLDAAQWFVEKGQVGSIRFSTRPDTVSVHTLGALGLYKVGVVEVGAQSMDDKVLRLCQRGHGAEDTTKAVALLKGHGLKVGLQIMPGLPGDTPASICETGQRIAELKPDMVRIYPTVVVKNTVLEKWYRKGRFKPMSLTEAVEATKRLYLLFQDRGISVIRMGLQATDSLLSPGHLVTGPFHPAFGHLVHSAIFLDLAVQALASQPAPPKRVVFKVHPQDLPKVIGFKKESVKRLIQQFDLDDLQILSALAVPKNTIEIA